MSENISRTIRATLKRVAVVGGNRRSFASLKKNPYYVINSVRRSFSGPMCVDDCNFITLLYCFPQKLLCLIFKTAQ